MSKLNLIIGPMFSQKCLNPDYKVYLFNGTIKKMRDLKNDDMLVTPEGNGVRILSTTKGISENMYSLETKTTRFNATGNHILVMENKDYYYSKITEKRGIIYYFDANKIFCHFPVLKKNIESFLKEKIKNKEILEKGNIIEIKVDRYYANFYMKFLLYPIKDIVHFKQISFKTFEMAPLFYDFLNVPEDILCNDYKIRFWYFYCLLKHESVKVTKIHDTLKIKLKNNTHRYKITKLLISLGISHFYFADCVCIYNFDIDLFLDKKIFQTIESTEMLIPQKINEKKEYIGFELEGSGIFMGADGYVMHNSTQIVNIVNKYSHINKKITVYNHSLDKNRYPESTSNGYYLVTHDKQNIPCKFIGSLDYILKDKDYLESDIIVIEEAQFFEGLDTFIISQLDDIKINKIFVVCGLSGDYKRIPFKCISNLISHADNIIKTESLCPLCADGTPAIYTKLIGESSENIISVGSGDKYQSVCRFHYV